MYGTNVLVLLMGIIWTADTTLEVKAPRPPTGDPVKIVPEAYIAHFAKEEGLFEIGGYSHLITQVKLSVYRDAVQAACGHLHDVVKVSSHPGLDHIADAVEMMDHRCEQVSKTANSQLRAMGSDEEWRQHWGQAVQNPFATERVPRNREERIKMQLESNLVLTGATEKTPSEPEMPAESIGVDNWPRRFTKAYVDWCRDHEETGICCVDKLFVYPDAENITQLDGCGLMIIPETQASSPYFNPLFMGKEILLPMYRSGNVSQIREVYLTMDAAERDRRFVIPMAIAGGTLFGAALDGVLGWFGYSMHTTADVKHINSNQDHIQQVAKQVALTEKFSKSIKAESHDIAQREQMTEQFLHMVVGLQALFDHMEMISGGLSVLFHHRRLSPLLIDRNAVVAEVRSVQVAQQAKGNVMLISPGDVWHAPVSYVVTRDLNIHIMIHMPIGKQSSFRRVFRYIPTPLAFSSGSDHFMVNPPNPFLLMDKNNLHPTEMSSEEMRRCESINHYKRFCPGRSILVNRSPPTCLSALHAGEKEHVLAHCPVALVDDRFPYVANLAFGEFTVYTAKNISVRVFCGELPHETQTLSGLSRVSLRSDCRLVHADFVLEPTIDFSAQDHQLKEIPLTFEDDLNMSQTMNWGVDRGLVRTDVKSGEGLTMFEVAHEWNNAKLDESIRWTFMMYVSVICGSVLSVVICCCCSRECWNIYQRSRQRNAVTKNIRAQVQEMGSEMQNLMRRGAVSTPTAPAE